MKITISTKEIFFATHSMLFYITDSKKNIPTELMSKNPLISDGKWRPSSLMGNADNLSKNVDVGVKNSRPKVPPPPAGRASVAILQRGFVV
jgi:hypothetical protein